MRKALAGVLVLLGSTVAWASAAPSESRDARLRRPVSLQGPRVYLGEALDEFGRQANVALNVSDQLGAASGVELLLVVRDRPLAEVMAAIEALLTSPYDAWSWRASIERGRAAYTLHHQRAWREVAESARRDMEQVFQNDCWSLYRASRQGPDQLRALKRTRPELVGLFTDAVFARAGLLAELDEDQFRRILRGELVEVPVTSLSRAGQAQLPVARSSEGLEPKETIGFRVFRDGRPFPRLSVAPGGNGFGSVIGSWSEPRWRKQAWPGWSHVGTDEQVRQEQDVNSRRSSLPPSRAAFKLSELLRRTAETYEFSVVAELRSAAQGMGGLDPARPLEETLVMLGGVGSGLLPWRKVGETYVFRRPDYLEIPRDGLVPWSQTKALREASGRNGGFLDLASLIRLAGLSRAQRERCADEFPDARSKQLDAWEPVLRVPSVMDPTRARRILSPAGLAARELSPAAQRVLFPPGKEPSWPGAEILVADANVVLSLGSEAEGDRRSLVWKLKPPAATETVHKLTLRKRTPLQAPGWMQGVAPGPAPTRSGPQSPAAPVPPG